VVLDDEHEESEEPDELEEVAGVAVDGSLAFSVDFSLAPLLSRLSLR
jgi:hypothetical protein